MEEREGVSAGPPDTPFFSDSFAEDAGDEDEDGDVKSLGTVDEQRLRSMARRKGIRTASGEEDLKREYEEFQRAERRMRDASGLSGTMEDPSLAAGGQMTPDYDIEEVTRDGDVDADAILASIGKRPELRKKGQQMKDLGGGEDAETPAADEVKLQPESMEEFLRYEKERAEKMQREQQDKWESALDAAAKEEVGMSPSAVEEGNSEDEDVIVYKKHATKWDKSSVSDQLYRSLASRGRGGDGDERKAEDREAFEDYLRKEEEMRRKVEGMDVVPTTAAGLGYVSVPPGTDAAEGMTAADAIEGYVDDVLDRLGPRPTPRKGGGGTQTGAVAAAPDFARDYADGDRWEDADEDDDDDDAIALSGSGLQPSTGSDQLPGWVRRDQEERRSEEFIKEEEDDDDDEATGLDYETKQRQAEEFEAKVTGKPHEVSLGDIFGRDYFGPDDEPVDGYFPTRGDGGFSSFERRKSDMMDYTELNVAEVNSLMDYREEDSGASRYMKRVQKPYREFGAVFRLEGLLADVTGLHREAWRRTAEQFGYKNPPLEEVRMATVHRAEYAVQRIFYWTDDFQEVRAVGKANREALVEVFDEWMESGGLEYGPTEPVKKQGSFDIDMGEGDDPGAEGGDSVAVVVESTSETEEVQNSDISSGEDNSPAPVAPTETEFLNMQLEAWTKAAKSYGLHTPTLKDVEAATFFNPEETVKRAFQWTQDSIQCNDIVFVYQKTMKKATDQWVSQHKPEDLSNLKKVDVRTVEAKTQKAATPSSGTLSEEDMLEMQLFSWTTAAEQHGLASPSLEDVQLASWVTPDEVSFVVFKLLIALWT